MRLPRRTALPSHHSAELWATCPPIPVRGFLLLPCPAVPCSLAFPCRHLVSLALAVFTRSHRCRNCRTGGLAAGLPCSPSTRPLALYQGLQLERVARPRVLNGSSPISVFGGSFAHSQGALLPSLLRGGLPPLPSPLHSASPHLSTSLLTPPSSSALHCVARRCVALHCISYVLTLQCTALH